MLGELATVAAYSASASFGRDVYKSLKNGGPIIAFLMACLITVLGFRNSSWVTIGAFSEHCSSRSSARF